MWSYCPSKPYVPLLGLQVPPQNANRMVDAARGILNQLLADVYIFTDAAAGAAAGVSPGYGITLVAETTSGCLLSAEATATQVRGGCSTSRDVGTDCFALLSILATSQTCTCHWYL